MATNEVITNGEQLKEVNQVSDSSTKPVVTPWKVEGNIDYARLVTEFGTELITDELQERFSRVIGKPLHPWIRRGIFFSHRGLEKLLDAYENGEPMFLYTGRGPSNDMHIGHMIPFLFTKWLQDVFDCPLVIQMSDEEKYYFKQLDFNSVYELGLENAKEIIAFGFNPQKTFIFSNRDYRIQVPEYEIFVSEMKKNISAKQVSKVFGFGECITDANGEEHYVYKEDVTVGMMDWPFYQSAAAFSQAFPHIFNGKPAHCLVSYAIDQDNYFRMARDLATKMKLLKPCSIMSIFLDPIKGAGKMSSTSGQEATIFLSDTPDVIRSKINKHAFSGSRGSGSLEEHRRLGGDVDLDIPCKYLKYFEFDDKRLEEIYAGFSSGEITCAQTKQFLADKLIEIILEHQKNRKLVTDELVNDFYQYKSITLNNCEKINNTVINEQEKNLYQALEQLSIKYETLYHKPITTMNEGIEIATKLKGNVCKNLLLQDNNKMLYMFITTFNSTVDTKTLCSSLGVPKLKFADKQLLQDIFNVPIGCLSVFALINSKPIDVTVVIDNNIDKNDFVNFHPLRNDATSTILYSDMIKFIEHNKYKIVYI
ncbi:unnamed protein product [Rotaria sordida]|uniref:tryptophan--tRNA ligase n=1 Tax=Rotaria sordida TaxID=392033 RepID=A0A815Q7K6_9BILA|nr:unnamed protein product [Rotaria sordida]